MEIAPGVLPFSNSCFDDVTSASATSELVSDTRVIGAPISSTVDWPTTSSMELVGVTAAPGAATSAVAAERAAAAGADIGAGADVGGTGIAAAAAIDVAGVETAAASGSPCACSPSVPQTAVTKIGRASRR